MARRRPTPLRQLSDLHPDPHNANRGTPRGLRLLEASLRDYGAGRSVLVDRAGRIIAGNKTVEEARRLGMPITSVPTNGRTLVVVQRRDLDLEHDPAARALAVADNRVAELDLSWDPAVLQQLRDAGLTLDAWWDDEEWAQLVGAPLTSDPREDAVLAPGPTTIQRGDLFACGRHRVACGDACDAADVARVLGDAAPVLMTTDPPYGVGYDPAWRHRAYPSQRTAVGQVAGDDRVAWPDAFRLFPGDVAYVWHAGLHAGTVAAALDAARFDLRAQIIWVKPHYVLSRGQYHWQHEPAWYAVRRGRSAHWRGGRTQSTVWAVPHLNPIGGDRTGDNAPTGHGTQKPVRLFEIPIRNHTTTGDRMYDPFLGSGSALIAAEKTGRVLHGLDIDPRYVQVALDRWGAYAGQRAHRLSRVRGTR